MSAAAVDPNPAGGSAARPIRAAIIGYGLSGRLSHACGLQANKEFQIVAACDASAENRERAARELGCHVYCSHQEMLAAGGLDLASVVTRSDTHAAITCDCLRSGIHTVVTKPWALDQAEAETLLAAQRESGRHLFPWIPMYWSPDYRMLRALLDRGAIGDVFLIRRHWTDFRRRHDWQTQGCYGGGYLLNWGMHILQPVVGLAGSPLRRVSGQLLQAINPGDTEDNFLAVMEFANGIRGIAEFTQSLFRLPSFLVQGTRGSLLADDTSVILKTMDPDDPESAREQTFPLEGKLFGDEAEIYRDIAATLLRGATFPVTPAMAMEGTRALEAVRRSHESGLPVILGG